MQQRHNIQESRRHCEDPYFVYGLNHPCNGMYRDDVSVSEDSYLDEKPTNLNVYDMNRQTQSTKGI